MTRVIDKQHLAEWIVPTQEDRCAFQDPHRRLERLHFHDLPPLLSPRFLEVLMVDRFGQVEPVVWTERPDLDIFVGPIMLVGDIRYQLGLTNLNTSETSSEESVKTRMWQFMAGIGLSL